MDCGCGCGRVQFQCLSIAERRGGGEVESREVTNERGKSNHSILIRMAGCQVERKRRKRLVKWNVSFVAQIKNLCCSRCYDFLLLLSITASDAVASANVVAAVFGVIANFVAAVATVLVAVAAVVLIATIVVDDNVAAAVTAALKTSAMQNFFRPL